MTEEPWRKRHHMVLQALHQLAGDEARVTVLHRDLARALGWTAPRSVGRAATFLERQGLLLIQHNGSSRKPGPNTYTFTAMGLLYAGMEWAGGDEMNDDEHEEETA